MRRHHVLRQVLLELRLDRLAQGCRPFAGTDGGHQIGHQLLTAGPFDCQYHAFAHGLKGQQPRLDFTQFDTEATHLDLMVDTPHVFDHAIGAVTGQVAGTVQTLARGREWVGHITFGRQAWTEQVATGDTLARQIQLGGDAYRYRLQLLVQQVAGGVVQGPANIGRCSDGAPGPGRIGSVFRWPVQVVDMLHRGLRIEHFYQRLLQRFTGQVDDAHTRGNLPGPLQGGNRRRHGVDQAHLIPGRQVRQLQGIACHDD
ncbi:hypothetical protein [Pseudomonas sp. 25 R 14]|nr:hypothetical protein [Pseudomonas sp. 25 R 14]